MYWSIMRWIGILDCSASAIRLRTFPRVVSVPFLVTLNSTSPVRFSVPA